MSWKLPAAISMLCILLYSMMFFKVDQLNQKQTLDLSPAIPTTILKIVGHTYPNQFLAEYLFIKTAVYYGGLSVKPSDENLDRMANHFKAMSELHPPMIDTYYRAEAALAHRGSDHVKQANIILEMGREALPSEVVLPFFEGFNYLNQLEQPKKAAQILQIASQIDGAPSWIGHLASILMADEGNIRSGLMLLKGMYASTQDEQEKERYKKDIQAFQKAWLVQQALQRYQQQYGKAARTLDDLVPDYLSALPTFKEKYILKYTPPSLSLSRRSQS